MINNQVIRNRKPKFTKIRSPYKKYQLADWTWLDIFNEIDLLQHTMKKGFFTFISKKYGVSYRTLTNKYYDFKNNIDNKLNNINDEGRGGINRIFTESDEKDIFVYLKTNFIDKSRMLCDEMIKLYAIDKCKELYPNKTFNASNGWCYMFKMRWNLSTVKCSISRIATTIHSSDTIKLFLENCITSYKSVGSSYFFNLDETKWNNINVSSTTIHVKGSDNAKILINGNEKEGFTLTLTISFSGKMLKPILTTKGSTNRCLNKYHLTDDIIGTFSNNGWTNNGIVKIALEQIYIHTKGKKSVLLLDQYSSHISNFTKEEALKRNITLIYVPEGLTYKYQPLDVIINGILKQKSKTLWRNEIIKNPDLKITCKDAVIHFLTAKKDITKNIIIKSFKSSCLPLLV